MGDAMIHRYTPPDLIGTEARGTSSVPRNH
ncbi:MAG: hypothetical protein RLZZ165_2215, partial [Bacteroidota bacterium]